MRVVLALGGNALLKRGEPLTVEAQRANVRVAARAVAEVTREHEVILTHGNGPQIGLLALQAAAYSDQEAFPLDVLGAESEGMIGYLLEQELLRHVQYIDIDHLQRSADAADLRLTHSSMPGKFVSSGQPTR